MEKRSFLHRVMKRCNIDYPSCIFRRKATELSVLLFYLIMKANDKRNVSLEMSVMIFTVLQIKWFLCFIFPKGLLLWFTICIYGGLRKVSWLLELLNIQHFLVKSVAIEGAACFQNAGHRSVLFTCKNRQYRSFL